MKSLLVVARLASAIYAREVLKSHHYVRDIHVLRVQLRLASALRLSAPMPSGLSSAPLCNHIHTRYV
jgi:hypothetical protein